MFFFSSISFSFVSTLIVKSRWWWWWRDDEVGSVWWSSHEQHEEEKKLDFAKTFAFKPSFTSCESHKIVLRWAGKKINIFSKTENKFNVFLLSQKSLHFHSTSWLFHFFYNSLSRFLLLLPSSISSFTSLNIISSLLLNSFLTHYTIISIVFASLEDSLDSLIIQRFSYNNFNFN